MPTDPRLALLRYPGTPTGLSFLVGDPITGVADLPEHYVEIHAFRDANFSQAFTEGLDVAAQDRGNTLVWDWEPDHRDGMRHVIVARLDRARAPGDTLAEAIPVIQHNPNRWEGKAIADHLAARDARDAEERALHARMMAPLRAALKEAGIVVHNAARLWLRCGETISISLENDGTYRVRCFTNYHKAQDDAALVERYAAHFASGGFTLDPHDPDQLGEKTAVSPEAAAALALSMTTAVKGMAPIAKAFWHDRFMAGFKLGRNLRTFLQAGAAHGILYTYHRGDARLMAGGITIKRADIADLRKAGYLIAEGRQFAVTPEGLAKAQEPTVRKPRAVNKVS